MASLPFNVAKGRTVELALRVVNNDPTNAGFVAVLLKTTEADATLQDRATLAAILANGNVECDFTGYVRKDVSDTSLPTPTLDNTANTYTVATPALQWTSAGGTTNNTVTRVVWCYCPDLTAKSDATMIPLSFHSVNETTNGNNLNLNAGNIAIAS